MTAHPSPYGREHLPTALDAESGRKSAQLTENRRHRLQSISQWLTKEGVS